MSGDTLRSMITCGAETEATGAAGRNAEETYGTGGVSIDTEIKQRLREGKRFFTIYFHGFEPRNDLRS